VAYNIILTRPSSIRFSSPLQVSRQKHNAGGIYVLERVVHSKRFNVVYIGMAGEGGIRLSQRVGTGPSGQF